MAHLSISKAWDEARVHLTRDGALLWPVALVFLALPLILFTTLVLTPELTAELNAKIMAQSLTPADVRPLMLWSLPVTLVNTIGALAISALVLRAGLSVGEALGIAVRRLLPVLGFYLLVAVVPGFVVGLVIRAVAPVSPVFAGLLAILYYIAFIVVIIRVGMIAPSIAVVEQGGPIQILKRAWRLSRGAFLRIVGAVLLAVVLGGVIYIAIVSIVGLVIAILNGFEPFGDVENVITQIVSGVVFGSLFLVFYVVAARIYAQLAGGEASVPATA